ncbi:MAG: alpha/beta hydrolase [Planctomycetota bacterium]|nr:alpha/beta hydrolase [Planctomycetota bacterium]
MCAVTDRVRRRTRVILGHSMGGYVTLAAWKMAPERFLALGLIDSQAAPDTEEGRSQRNQLANQVANEGSANLEADMLSKLFASNLDAKNPLIGQVQQIIRATPRAGIVGALHGMAERPDASATLATITVPTMILTGDCDQLIAPSRATAMAAVVPNAMLAVITNAGHMPMMEQPAAATTTLRSFLSTVGNGLT